MSDIFRSPGGELGREQIPTPPCPHCDSKLALHQPDSQLPHRLLAVCEACKRWYVLDAGPLRMIASPDDDQSRTERPR